jgi:serine/threonine-protein kinase
MVTHTIDGISFELREAYDFSFLHKYGRVFQVFADQDSGNICFGVDKDEERLFVKFAGAPTVAYKGDPAEAVLRLRRTVPVYRDLAHPALIRFRCAEAIGGGFAAVFDWVDGECMGKQYPVSRQAFLQLPDAERLQVFAAIVSFHQHVVAEGYVAIDFYDGSVMYDFGSRRTYLCDIDFYERAPVVNTMGRMWGSSRFMSPEEYTLGAPIDEITHVYTMGAMAFALFGGETDRSPGLWRLGDAAYQVALRAVREERSERFGSLAAFAAAWAEATGTALI